MLSNAIVSRRVADPRGKKTYYVRGPKKGQIKEQDMTSLSVLYTRQVTAILWAGNVDEAIQYLNNIDPEHVDKPFYMKKLLTYLSRERKGNYITCYALRRRVGLRNSSNGVEGVNNQIVANDQKVANKTYRSNGSYAIAALKALESYREWNDWFQKRTFTFNYIPAQS